MKTAVKFFFLIGSPLTVAVALAAEPTPIGNPPAIPGVASVASLGQLCPGDAPVRVDLNNDRTEDLLWLSYHQGNLKSYAPPEILGLAGMKAMTGNKNFTYAGALDGISHKPLWAFEAGAMIDKQAFVQEGRRLYLGSHDNHIYALNAASGGTVWKHDLEGNVLGLVASASEVVAVTTRNKVKGFATADGSTLWEKTVKTAVMAHPQFGIVREDDKTIYVSSLDNHVYALERRSGKVRWDYGSGGNPSLRIIADGMLLIADQKRLVAIETASGKVRWEYDIGGWVHGEPIVDLGGAVGLFNGQLGKKAAFLALGLADGKLRWSVNLEKIPVDKSRKIFVPDDSYIFKTTLRVKRDQSGRVELLYIADRKKVWAIQPNDGKARWTAEVPDAQLVYPSGGQIFVADKKKVIHAVDAQNGTPRWQHETEDHVFQMERLGSVLLVVLYSGDLVVLDFVTGKAQGKFRLDEPFRVVSIGPDRVALCAKIGTWILAPGRS